MKKKFRSTNNLKFKTAPFVKGDNKTNLLKFRCGTCNGIMDTLPLSVDIIKVENAQPYNGHMRDVFEWIIEYARLEKKPLVIKNVKGAGFKQKLLENWQFQETKNPEVLIRFEHCK